MSTWTPTTLVTLDGVNVTGTSVAGVRLTRGRDNVDDQPRAGYATVTLLDLDADNARPRLDAPLSVTVDGVPLATDLRVTDVAVSMTNRHVAAHTITAVGPLARLHRLEPDSSYPQEFDGDRIARILGVTAVTTQRSGGRLRPGPSFSTHLGTAARQATDAVDTPGIYELAAVAEPGGRWAEAQSAANDGLGVLAELADGSIRYTDATGRLDRVLARGFTTIPAGALVLPGMAVTSSLANMVNRVVLTYDGGEVVAEDTEAQALYGVLERRVTTTLVDGSDAQSRADRLLALRSADVAFIEQVAVTLNGDLTTEERSNLLSLEVGEPIRIDGLPATLGTAFTGFVEAVSWTVTRTTVSLDLRVSDYAFSEVHTTWQHLASATPTTWNDVDPSIDWADAHTLIGV